MILLYYTSRPPGSTVGYEAPPQTAGGQLAAIGVHIHISYVYVHVCVCMYVYVCIYIYIYREREREGEIDR